MYQGGQHHHGKNHSPLANSAFLGLPGWWAGRVRGGAVVGELVVDAKLPPLHLVAVPARVHGVVDVAEVHEGGYTLRRMLLRQYMHFFNLAEPAECV